MAQFSKNGKKKYERIEARDPLYFLKDQTSHYINICISSSKMVFYCQQPTYTVHIQWHAKVWEPLVESVKM